jgi:hypothetical protein
VNAFGFGPRHIKSTLHLGCAERIGEMTCK